MDDYDPLSQLALASFANESKGDEQKIVMHRCWAMPNDNTFTIKPIHELISRHITKGLWIDPFSRNSPFSHLCITNDLNPDVDADFHEEALAFLNKLIRLV